MPPKAYLIVNVDTDPDPVSVPQDDASVLAKYARLRTILDEWKTISGLDRKVDDALWKRYSGARDTFNRRRGSGLEIATE